MRTTHDRRPPKSLEEIADEYKVPLASLSEAVRSAEIAFECEISAEETRVQAREIIPHLKKLRRSVEKLQRNWKAIPRSKRERVSSWTSPGTKTMNPVNARLDDVIDFIEDFCEHNGRRPGNQEVSRSGGGKNALAPLKVFTESMALYWKSEKQRPVGHLLQDEYPPGSDEDSGVLEPHPEGMRFIFDVAGHLPESYTATNLKTALRSL
ncbi:hypothetical protein [Mesorhizobium sp. LjNodule214]|uniref:hypothetical protein n=1 Tax=Mesorhizobium sp. LjNodule214 TaxID=3342252 RepID=UPI003ED0981F